MNTGTTFNRCNKKAYGINKGLETTFLYTTFFNSTKEIKITVRKINLKILKIWFLQLMT